MAMRRFVLASCGLLGAAVVGAAPAWADVAVVGASLDNTLYQDAAGGVSNGIGQHLFAGRTSGGARRRGLISFDVAGAVPAGATVTGVTLTLTMSRGGPELVGVGVHRVLAGWGEGSTDASGEEGGGGLATPGSATWLHRFYDGTLWGEAGGDFAAAASGATTVGDLGTYAWSSAGMVADVQAWLDGTAGNFGWALLGEEATTSTTKRFDSRENPLESARPRLVVEYVPAPGSAAALAVIGAAAWRRRRR